MKKQTVLVSISKKDGSLKFETHGVKGKACVEMLEELLGELVDISDSELKDDYYEENDVHVTTESESEIEVGDKE